jgi:hypothetical protein
MVRKSALALCGMALWAAALALPASAQDSQLKVAHGTFTNITRDIEPRQLACPPNCIIYNNNFSQSAALNTEDLTNALAPNGYEILGPTNTTGNRQQSISAPFVPTGTGTQYDIKNVVVPVTCFSAGCPAGTAGFELAICADNGLGAPAYPAGCTLEQKVATATFPISSGGVSVNIVPNFEALGGTQYWVVVDANPVADTATQDIWQFVGGPSFAVCDGAGCAWSQGGADLLYEVVMKITATKP